MCELFAMSSRFPTSVGFSLETLARRGGHDGPHKDGWGVAYFEEHDVFLLRESSPAAESGLVRFMEANGPPSNLVLSHIRLATQGDTALKNTQPFQRELAGRAHVFAHNGNLENVQDVCRLESDRFTPVGDTDSEHAFCCLLHQLATLWRTAHGRMPSIEARLEVVAGFAATLRPLGAFNFVYSDGDALFIHSHRRKKDNGEEGSPGLYLLVRSREQKAVDLSESGIMVAPFAQQMALVASVPLTDEDWQPIDEGDVIALTHGLVRAHVKARQMGSDLFNKPNAETPRSRAADC